MMADIQPSGKHPLNDIVSAQKAGEARGCFSVCSAHPDVLETAMEAALQHEFPLLIEATSNQVNQYGGYTGMTPAQFATHVMRMAERCRLPPGRLILGGDHLGPNVWQREPAETAMEKARTLVCAYVQAGCSKIHLDASMKLGDDDPQKPLDLQLSAQRTAELCVAAEEAFAQLPSVGVQPVYVIGSEVPLPGGAQEKEEGITVTRVDDARATLEATCQAFQQCGLQSAWERVIALVVQPGVEFADDSLFVYDRSRAVELSRFIETQQGLVYEAHSTDYQPRQALRQLMEDHFAILKVGPALTFAFREAVFALAWMEREWLGGQWIILSNLQTELEEVMLEKPRDWRKYYHGDREAQHFARQYSYSDRSRYYWPDPRVQKALKKLFTNLEEHPVPLTLLSQFLPQQYDRVRAGILEYKPRAWVKDKIMAVLEDYLYACGHLP
jgi:D-tagatose-1,6-bisphosphate aldolase subunit GatZ/KbaZ